MIDHSKLVERPVPDGTPADNPFAWYEYEGARRIELQHVVTEQAGEIARLRETAENSCPICKAQKALRELGEQRALAAKEPARGTKGEAT